MENRQRTIRKLLWRITAVLAVLAVVSICFVSGTFARYVSNRSGSTVTEVAKWDIDFTDGTKPVTNNFTVKVGKLSPSKDAFTVGSDGTVTNRKKSSGTVLALKITNSGDVDATLTITSPVVTGGEEDSETPATPKIIYYSAYTTGGTITEYTDWGTTGFQVGGKPTESEANNVFSMEFALTKSDTAAGIKDGEWKSISDFSSTATTPVTVQLPAKTEDAPQGTTYYFYARAVWTSRDEYYYQQNQQTAEDMSDGLDTWLGEHIAAVGAAFTFSVVQASELPGTNP